MLAERLGLLFVVCVETSCFSKHLSGRAAHHKQKLTCFPEGIFPSPALELNFWACRCKVLALSHSANLPTPKSKPHPHFTHNSTAERSKNNLPRCLHVRRNVPF